MNEKNESLTDREMLTQKEAAKEYRTTRQTLTRMRKNGLPFYRLNSKVLYDRRELEAFMRRGSVA